MRQLWLKTALRLGLRQKLFSSRLWINFPPLCPLSPLPSFGSNSDIFKLKLHEIRGISHLHFLRRWEWSTEGAGAARKQMRIPAFSTQGKELSPARNDGKIRRPTVGDRKDRNAL